MALLCVTLKPEIPNCQHAYFRPARHSRLTANASSGRPASSNLVPSRARISTPAGPAVTKLESIHRDSGETPSIEDHVEATRLKFAQLEQDITAAEEEHHGMYFSHIASRLVHGQVKVN